MRLRVSLLALLVVASIAPAGAATTGGVVAAEDAFSFQADWSTSTESSQIWLFGSVRTEMTATGPTVVRKTYGELNRCDWSVPVCVQTDLTGARTEAQMSFEPLMNAVVLDFCEGTVCIDVRLSQPGNFVVNCVSVGCISTNPWVDGLRAHVDAQLWQGISRGNYQQGLGSVDGLPLGANWNAQGWISANAMVTATN